MLDHISIQVRDVAAATAFYDAVFVRPLDRIARIAGRDVHPDQEPIEARQGRDPSADRSRRRLPTRRADPVRPGKDVGRRNRLGRARAFEERPEEPRVRLDCSSGA